jgi:hypothetical protein
VGRLWICHRIMWAPAAGCGVFLYELVPSDVTHDDPFMWCLYETFFFSDIYLFFPTEFFFPSEQ